MENEITAKEIESKILTIRNQQVMIDRDFAEPENFLMFLQSRGAMLSSVLKSDVAVAVNIQL